MNDINRKLLNEDKELAEGLKQAFADNDGYRAHYYGSQIDHRAEARRKGKEERECRRRNALNRYDEIYKEFCYNTMLRINRIKRNKIKSDEMSSYDYLARQSKIFMLVPIIALVTLMILLIIFG